MTFPLTGRIVTPHTGPRLKYYPSVALPKTSEYPLPSKSYPLAIWGDEIWWNECGRKEAHFDERSADRHIEELGTSRKSGMTLNKYICRWCDWWHVGHTKRKR